MEGVVGPQSLAFGRRLVDLDLRRLYGAYVLAVHRQGEQFDRGFDQVRLRVGDTVLVEAPSESMARMFERREFVNLSQPSERPYRRGKAPLAILAGAVVMLLAAVEVMPVAALALIAAGGAVAFGCLGSDEAYDAGTWGSLELDI